MFNRTRLSRQQERTLIGLSDDIFSIWPIVESHDILFKFHVHVLKLFNIIEIIDFSTLNSAMPDVSRGHFVLLFGRKCDISGVEIPTC